MLQDHQQKNVLQDTLEELDLSIRLHAQLDIKIWLFNLHVRTDQLDTIDLKMEVT